MHSLNSFKFLLEQLIEVCPLSRGTDNIEIKKKLYKVPYPASKTHGFIVPLMGGALHCRDHFLHPRMYSEWRPLHFAHVSLGDCSYLHIVMVALCCLKELLIRASSGLT